MTDTLEQLRLATLEGDETAQAAYTDLLIERGLVADLVRRVGEDAVVTRQNLVPRKGPGAIKLRRVFEDNPDVVAIVYRFSAPTKLGFQYEATEQKRAFPGDKSDWEYEPRSPVLYRWRSSSSYPKPVRRVQLPEWEWFQQINSPAAERSPSEASFEALACWTPTSEAPGVVERAG